MSVPNAFTTVTSATGAQLDANFAACHQLNATNVLATDGDQQVVSQGSTNGKLRTGTCSATSGNLFTVFGSSVVEYTSYNVPISSVGAFGTCDISGVCWIRGVTATGIEKWYTATGTASVAPSTGSFTLYKSYNIATGAEIFVVPPSMPGFVQGQTLIPTAAGTTTLTVSSTYEQIFQGSTTQTCAMPVVSTLTLGQSFWLKNESTGAVTVNSSGSNLIVTLNSGDQALLTCILITGTTAASWDLQINAQRNGDVTQTMLVAPATLGTHGVQASQLFGFRNKIINGNFTNNQRAVSGTVTLGAGVYGHDRWKGGAGGCTYTFSTTNNVTTINISAGTLQQVIEGSNLFSGNNKLSWTGTAQARVDSGSYGATGLVGTSVGGTNQTIEFGTGTVSLVQYEVGTVATPFEQRPLSFEKQLCTWYFRQLSIGNGGQTCVGTAQTAIQGIFNFPPMRASPSPTYTGTLATLDGNTVSNVSSLAASSGGGGDSIVLQASTAATQTAGHGLQLYANGTACTVLLSAEL